MIFPAFFFFFFFSGFFFSGAFFSGFFVSFFTGYFAALPLFLFLAERPTKGSEAACIS